MNTSLPKNVATTKVSKTGFAFILVTSLFFLWGFWHQKLLKLNAYLLLGSIRNKQRLKLERHLQLEQHRISKLKKQE